MRFLDSSVFLHAYLKPKRRLTEVESRVKEKAKNIIMRIDSGSEKILISVIHIGEIVNIIESRLGLKTSIELLAKLLLLNNIKIVDVNRRDIEEAIYISDKYKISINDAIAYIKMKQCNIKEIYTFDKHFKKLPDIKVIQE